MKSRIRRVSWVACLLVAFGSGRAVYADLVANGSFQTGDFSDWSLTQNGGSPSWYSIQPYTGNGGIPPTSGSVNFAYIGPYTPPDILSQTIATTANEEYRFSFDLSHTTYDGDGGAEFTASFGNQLLLDEVGLAEPGIMGAWQSFSFDVVATGPSTTLDFTFLSPPGYYGFTNVDLEDLGQAGSQAVPDAASSFCLLGATLLALTGLSNRLRAVAAR
jgi:hypothetical protein